MKNPHYTLFVVNDECQLPIFKFSYNTMGIMLNKFMPIAKTTGIIIDGAVFDDLAISCDDKEDSDACLNFKHMQEFLDKLRSDTKPCTGSEDINDALALGIILEITDADYRNGYMITGLGKSFIECWTVPNHEHLIQFQRFVGTWGGSPEYENEYRYSLKKIIDAFETGNESFFDIKNRYQEEFMDGFVRYYEYTDKTLERYRMQLENMHVPIDVIKKAVARISA